MGDDVKPDELDESTVAELHLMTPAYSSHDSEAIKALFTGTQKVIFPSIQDLRVRERIAQRLLECRRIVTFQSFFQDFTYLGACFDGLKGLLPQKWSQGHESFRSTMYHKHWNSVRAKRTALKGTTNEDFMYHYVDMWLSAQRDFPSLSDGKASRPLQDKTPVNNKRSRPEVEAKGVQFAYKAYNNYFENSRIKKIMREHIEIPQDSPSDKRPEVSTHDSALASTGRSNRPHQGDFDRNRGYLHPVYVFDNTTVERKTYATAFAIARDILHCCWTDAFGVKRWVPQAPLDAPNMATTEGALFVEKPRLTLHFKESGSQRGKSMKTDVSRGCRDSELYRHLIRQVSNPFLGTEDVEMSNHLPVGRHIDYEGQEMGETDNAKADEGTRNNSSFGVAEGAAIGVLPVHSGIGHAPRFDDTFNVFHGVMTNRRSAEQFDRNNETGTTDRESLTVAPLRWQVRHGLSSSQAPSPSEYSNPWPDEVSEAEEHIKSGMSLFEDDSNHRRDFISDLSNGNGEIPQRSADSREPTKHDNEPEMTSPPDTTLARDSFLNFHNAKIPAPTGDIHRDEDGPSEPSDGTQEEISSTAVRVSPITTVEKLNPRVEDLELHEPDSSAVFTLPGLDEARRGENSNSSNFERDQGSTFKGRRMTEVPDGLGILPGSLKEREGDPDRKRKRGTEEEWKFKSARREGRFRPQAH